MKLASLARMADGIAHDFNNLLLAIVGNSDLLDQDLRAGRDGLPLLDEIRKAAGRAADFCNQLSAFAGRGHYKLQTLDLSQTIREMLPMLKVAVSRRVALRLDLADDLPLIEADVGQIHQVIMNLVVNAAEALDPEGGSITLASGVGVVDPSRLADCVVGEQVPEGEFVFLEVEDTGEGMDAATLAQIFDPFFTTKIQGRGLGLASVLGIARGHMAVLRVDSRPGSGSRFRLHFPLTGVPSAALGPTSAAATRKATPGTILVVDDEEYVRVLGQRMLERLGYRVVLAPDGPGALKLFQAHRGQIDCVMLDLVMPEMDGAEVFEHLVGMDPNVQVVLTSGYHEQEIATRFAGKGLCGFLQKPYVIADLARTLEKVLDPASQARGPSAKQGREF